MKIKVLFCTILTLALLATQPLYAQVKKKSKKSKEEETTEYFDESGGLKHRLWPGFRKCWRTAAYIAFPGSAVQS